MEVFITTNTQAIYNAPVFIGALQTTFHSRHERREGQRLTELQECVIQKLKASKDRSHLTQDLTKPLKALRIRELEYQSYLPKGVQRVT